MTCCKNIKLSFETNSAFKKAYKFQWKNAHSTVLQNAWNQKNNTFSIKKKKQFHHQKPIVFIQKRSWMTKKPEAPRKIDYGPSKIKKSFVHAMTCCKNIKLSFETNSAFKKAYKFQWKNAHSTVLQNAWNQKTNTFSKKSNFTIKNQWFSFKNDPGWQKTLSTIENKLRARQKFKNFPEKKRNDLLQKRKTFFEKQICFEKGF